MIGCPYCGHFNRRGSKYCGNCGRRLDTVTIVGCPSCNAPNPLGSSLCTFCGASLATAAPGEDEDAAVQPPVPYPEERVETQVEESERIMPSPPEVPSWLYERPAEQPEKVETSIGEPLIAAGLPSEQEANKYLQGIRGVLPSAGVWVSSAISRSRPKDAKSRPRLGKGQA